MSQTIDMPNYTIELSDGLIRPMTVKELAVRLEQMMAADKGIAGMPVGLSVDSEGNGVYGPVFLCRRSPGTAIRWTMWSVSLPKRIAPIMVFPSAF